MSDLGHPIVDAHVHHWDLRTTPREASPFVKLLGWNQRLMEWVATKASPSDVAEFFGGPSQVLSNYMPPDYRDDIAGVPVAGYVHVEAGWQGSDPLAPVGETRWLEATCGPQLLGIVAAADLTLGDAVAATLEAHLEASARVRGARHPLGHHPSKRIWSACARPDLMTDETWRRGYARLAEFGLSFDAAVYHHQLDDLCELASRYPDVPVAVCHAGTPTGFGGSFGGFGESDDERQQIARDWQASMTRLACLPHVSVKLSGLAMPIVGFGYERLASRPGTDHVAADFAPIIDFVVETFGPERCMFGSNFPVDDRVSLAWTTLLAAIRRVVEGRSEADRKALLASTATAFYRLDGL